MPPFPGIIVTTRIITFLVGDPYKTCICHYYWEGGQPRDMLVPRKAILTVSIPARTAGGPRELANLLGTRNFQATHGLGKQLWLHVCPVEKNTKHKEIEKICKNRSKRLKGAL